MTEDFVAGLSKHVEDVDRSVVECVTYTYMTSTLTLLVGRHEELPACKKN